MSLYTGLSPEDALSKWYAIRQKPQAQQTPEEQQDVAGNMTGLSQQNPGAWSLLKSGKPPTGDTRQIFNPQSGQWDAQKVQGFWSHPESWLQVLGGAALGGVAAAPLFMGGGGAAAGSGVSATASGAGGTLPATGFIGSASTVPTAASLAPSVGGAATAAGGSAVSKALKYLAPGLAGASVIGGLAKGSGGSTQQVPLPPELQQMLDLQKSRMQSQQPMYDAIQKMALNRLPTAYRGGQ